MYNLKENGENIAVYIFINKHKEQTNEKFHDNFD